ncbi:DUF3806 domain-containing protein [Solimonas terrae]|uniref:DUF3806 domain-containing protein n=1 Tax=Solimonas terrae TaxID=1396819 RepID=A0A6M2BQK4_9GAMM|nr:DUF3806 domain-containing protein [Solimonas terrae]NGY04738.1 DUF3806 domain-containing protein [Solimonas terrae]
MKTVLLVILALFSAGAFAVEPIYSELDAEWSSDLAAKRAFVAALAEKHYGYRLSGTAKDLPVLQRIVDENLVSHENTADLQALGVVFGDATAADINAEWKQVKDEYGENPVLKIRGKRAAIGALTIISKRIEDQGTVNVIMLHDNLVRDVKRLSSEFGVDSH